MTLPILSTTQLVFMRPVKGEESTVLRYLKSHIQNSQEACGHKCCILKEGNIILILIKSRIRKQNKITNGRGGGGGRHLIIMFIKACYRAVQH